MTISQQYGADLIEYAEMRDAWLAVLLPVCVAGLLLLLLIVYRRRRGSTTPDQLFRSYRLADAQEWLGARFAARERRRAAESAAERHRAEVERQQAEVDAARTKWVREEAEARATRHVATADGQVLLQVGQRVYVETMLTRREGLIRDITESGLEFRDWWEKQSHVIPWEQVRGISVRQGPPYRRAIPITLAIVGAALLGAVGWILDQLPSNSSSYLTLIGMAIGAALAGGFGLLIMYALPGPKWRTLVELRPGAPPLTFETLPERSVETARPSSEVQGASGVQVAAGIALAAIVLGTCGFFS